MNFYLKLNNEYLSIQGADICASTSKSNATWFTTREFANQVRDGYKLFDFEVHEEE